MQNMNALIADKQLQTIVRSIIETNWVSVSYDPSGTLKEYNIVTTDGVMLSLEASPTFGNGKNHYFEYSIWLDDTEIANVVVPQERKIYSPSEEIVLSFFDMCSSKVIWQEMQNKLKNTLGGLGTKQYTC